MKNFFAKAWEKFIELLFPSNLKCFICNRDIPADENKTYCDHCAANAPFNKNHRCKVCDTEIIGDSEVCDFCQSHHRAFNKAVAPMKYEGDIKNLVLKLKSDNAKYLAPKMAKLMADRILEEGLDVDVIIPVPLSPKSLKKRGYNQSELLANEIGKILNKDVCISALSKIKDTAHQKELTFLDRQKNLHDAFKVTDKKVVFGKNVLLVDDVITTCATANECSKALNKFTKRVYVVSFARSEYKNLEK